MKISIWSDFTCPFCYIGKAALEIAINNLKLENVEMEYRSFLLNPEATRINGQTMEDYMLESGMDKNTLENALHQINTMASELDLPMDYENAIPTNTIMAHRLSHYGKTQGKMAEIMDSLYKAHFAYAIDIGDRNGLIKIGEELGFDREELIKVLDTNRFAEEVQEDLRQSRILEVDIVPFFLFDNKYILTGAQPIDVFMEALKKVEEEV